MNMSRYSLSFLLCLALACLLAACAPQQAAPPVPLSEYNVLIVVIDALRADHLGCYGYGRPTSPFLDELAQEGLVFERAQSNSSYTNESVSALFSGQFPSANPWGTGWQARPNPDRPVLAELFQKAGRATALFSETPQLNYPAFFRGCDETECFSKHGLSGQAPLLVERTLRFFREHGPKRKFTYVHILDPHAPYDPPEDFYARFAEPPLPKEQRLRLYEDVRPNVPALVASGFGPGDPRFEDLVSRYDAEIAFVDAQLRRLFDGLCDLGALDRTLVIITADHGEEFLEHGFVEHAWRLYWESVQVPLLVWAPEIFAPRRVPERVSLVDLYPTLLALCGIACDANGLDGSALFKQTGATWEFVPPVKPIIAELMLQTRTLLRMAQIGDTAYMEAQRWLTPAECSEAARVQAALRHDFASGARTPVDIRGPGVHYECYDLAADPKQQHDLAPTDAGACAEGRAVLEAYRACCPVPVGEGAKLISEAGVMTPELEEQLRALGYLDGAEAATAPPKMDETQREQLRDLGYF